MGDDHGTGPVHREMDADGEEPTLQLVEIVADVEGKDPQELPPTYDHIDHVIDHIFTNPPVPEANVEISFDYEGYRITVDQKGRMILRPNG
jgi:hypothetical protein